MTALARHASTALLASLSVLTLGCPSSDGSESPEGDADATESPAADADGPLVVYCGRGEGLVGPLLERFTEAEGIEVDVRYNDTPAVAGQLLAEGAESPADVLFAQDSGYLGALADAEVLAPLPQALLDRVDPRFHGPDGRWVGTSGRLRALVYDTEAVSPEDLPESLKGLADPKWKGKLGWAPGNGSFQAHVSALRHLWGEDETREWLEAVAANEPTVYPKNSPQVMAAHAGEIQVGWVNHYYLHKLKEPGFTAANYSFRAEEDAGNVLMVAGAGLRAGTPRREQAEALLEFLLSEESQRYFTTETFEYPTVPGIPTHEDVTPLEELSLAPVEQRHLADVEPTLELLRELGLQ